MSDYISEKIEQYERKLKQAEKAGKHNKAKKYSSEQSTDSDTDSDDDDIDSDDEADNSFALDEEPSTSRPAASRRTAAHRSTTTPRSSTRTKAMVKWRSRRDPKYGSRASGSVVLDAGLPPWGFSYSRAARGVQATRSRVPRRCKHALWRHGHRIWHGGLLWRQSAETRTQETICAPKELLIALRLIDMRRIDLDAQNLNDEQWSVPVPMVTPTVLKLASQRRGPRPLPRRRCGDGAAYRRPSRRSLQKALGHVSERKQCDFHKATRIRRTSHPVSLRRPRDQ